MKERISKLLDTYKTMAPAAKAGLWFVICSVVQRSFSMITTPIFTRLLTREQFGEYSTYLAWLQLFTIICTFRLDLSVFNKGMSKYPEKKEEYTATMQTLTTGIVVIVLLVYWVLQKYINQFTGMNTVVTTFIFLEILFTAAMNFWMLRQRYDFKYRGVVLVTIGMMVVNLFVGLGAVLVMEEKGFARIISCIFVQICFGLAFYIINFNKSKKLYLKEYARFAFVFNLPLIPYYFSSYVLEQSDKIMIEKMCGMQAVALYSVSYNIGQIVKVIINSLTNALIPWQYRKLESGEYGEIDRYLTKVAWGIAGVAFLCIVFAPLLIYVLAGKVYLEAVYVVPPVALGMFFVFIYGLICNIEFFYDVNKFSMYASFMAAIINLVLNVCMIPIFGYVAAGYTTLIGYAFLFLVHSIYVNRLHARMTGNQVLLHTKSFWMMAVIIGITAVASSIVYPVFLKLLM